MPACAGILGRTFFGGRAIRLSASRMARCAVQTVFAFSCTCSESHSGRASEKTSTNYMQTRKHNQQNERTRACTHTHTHTHTHTRTHAGRSSLSQHDAPLMSGVSSDCSLGASESHERFEGESESSFSSPACSRRAALLWTSLELALGRVVFVAALKNFMRPFVWARRGKNEENALALARDPGSMRLHCWRAHSGTTSLAMTAIFL